jgi:hypothetical protein
MNGKGESRTLDERVAGPEGGNSEAEYLSLDELAAEWEAQRATTGTRGRKAAS